MTYGWLALPLLGGYLLANYLPPLRYYHRYLDRQRLVFHSSLAGAGLLLSAVALLTGFSFLSAHVERLLESTVAFNEVAPYATLAFLLGLAVTTIGHLLTGSDSRNKLVYKAIQQVGNPLDAFLAECYYDRIRILITLDNRKCYVALLQSIPDPKQTEYVRIVPIVSGYRDEQHIVHLTTDYSPLLTPDSSYVLPEILIELGDITSFAKFDEQAYEELYRSNSS